MTRILFVFINYQEIAIFDISICNNSNCVTVFDYRSAEGVCIDSIINNNQWQFRLICGYLHVFIRFAECVWYRMTKTRIQYIAFRLWYNQTNHTNALLKRFQVKNNYILWIQVGSIHAQSRMLLHNMQCA